MPDIKQLKITVSHALAIEFKDACAKRNVSMAAALSGFMEGFAHSPPAWPIIPPSEGSLATRRQRRAMARCAIAYIKAIRDAEAAYMDRIPENLQYGMRYECAENAVDALEQAIDALQEAFPT